MTVSQRLGLNPTITTPMKTKTTAVTLRDTRAG